MKILRYPLKLLLFPVTLILSLTVAIARLLTQFSTGLLSIAAFACLLVGIGSIVLLKEPLSQAWRPFLAAWLISPFGLPFIAGFLVELAGIANGALKRI